MVRGPGPAGDDERAAAGGARAADQYGFPGPAHQPAPAVPGRLADRRGHAGARLDQPRGRQPAGRRAARHGRHPPPGRARQRLPAPVLRWHAPARDDRDGPGAVPGADHRRRADHGARRHRPGSGARAAGQASGRAGHLAHPDHPRPGCRRRPGGRGPGHVQRTTRLITRTPAGCSSPFRWPATPAGSGPSPASRRACW